MRRGLLVAALLAALLAGCGGHGATDPAAAHEWRANARQVVQQLRGDIETAELGGTTRTVAARSLADVSHLYALLVAYSDLGGCRAMVTASAPPARVALPLDRACTHLQRAASLFARAAQGPDPASLTRATLETRRAQPPLVEAMLAIRRG